MIKRSLLLLLAPVILLAATLNDVTLTDITGSSVRLYDWLEKDMHIVIEQSKTN